MLTPNKSILILFLCSSIAIGAQAGKLSSCLHWRLTHELADHLARLDATLDDIFIQASELLDGTDSVEKCQKVIEITQSTLDPSWGHDVEPQVDQTESTQLPAEWKEKLSKINQQLQWDRWLDDFLLMEEIFYLALKRVNHHRVREERRKKSTWSRAKCCFRAQESRSNSIKRQDLITQLEKTSRYCVRLFGLRTIPDRLVLSRDQLKEVRRFHLSAEPDKLAMMKKIDWIVYLREQILSIDRHNLLDDIVKQKRAIRHQEELDYKDRKRGNTRVSGQPIGGFEDSTNRGSLQRTLINNMYDLLNVINHDLDHIDDYDKNLVYSAIKMHRP